MRAVLLSVAMMVVPWSAGANNLTVETIAEGLENPWTVAFLPDGRLLVTERPGRIRVIDASGLQSDPVAGLPEVFASGQAGLFDILLAPDFADSNRLFVSFAYGDDDANHTRIIRARLDGDRLVDVEPIFTTHPAKSGDAHFGGRMAWASDGSLLMGTGDGFYFRELSQQLDNHHGKIIRIDVDGQAPPDNPFVGRPDVLPEIYSYGHRHVQSIVVDEQRGRVFAHEHGPRGGDELNHVEAGANYGWPLVSYGLDYSRALITPFTDMPGMKQPLHYWVPSIAPGGMALYQGGFAPWRNSLFVAALAEKSLRRVELDAAGMPGEQEILLEDLDQRIRDVRSVPGDDAVYIVTDETDGKLLRVRPGDTDRTGRSERQPARPVGEGEQS